MDYEKGEEVGIAIDAQHLIAFPRQALNDPDANQ